MPTYKVSPFLSPNLQSYLFTSTDIDQNGKVNVTGAPGNIYTAHIKGGSGQNYILIWDGTAATTEAADIVIPSGSGEDLVMYVDKGITCSTAITFAGSSVPQGGVAPADTGNNLAVNLFIS